MIGSGYTLLRGSAREKLDMVRAESVQTCITSPPYWGLRDYDVQAEVWDDPGDCDHTWGAAQRGNQDGNVEQTKYSDAKAVGAAATAGAGRFCTECGAWEGQLGLEPTPDLYIEHVCECFDAVHRTLRKDGTLWVVIGDTYARRGLSAGAKIGPKNTLATGSASGYHNPGKYSRGVATGVRKMAPGLKQGDLVGIPWMLAFALRDRGWYLRQEVIWGKPNGMPESVRSRCTRVHEQIFMFSKSHSYFYDHEAIKELAVSSHPSGNGFVRSQQISRGGRGNVQQWTPTNDSGPKMRNKRSVWMVNTRQFKDAHFAVFPHKIVEPCLLAGSSEGDVVLDSFAGTGTVGEVAAQHGRRFIGVELSDEYADMAEAHLSKAYDMVGSSD